MTTIAITSPTIIEGFVLNDLFGVGFIEPKKHLENHHKIQTKTSIYFEVQVHIHAPIVYPALYDTRV